MTWDEFKRAVDEVLEAHQLDGSVAISRIDVANEASEVEYLKIDTSAFFWNLTAIMPPLPTPEHIDS